MYKIIAAIFIAHCLLSCQKEKTEIQPKEEQKTVSNTVTKRDINKLNFKDLAISEELRQFTNNWLKFIELQSHIDEIRRADFVFFKINYADINLLFSDLKKNIPEKFNTNTIISRINLLDTKITIFCGHLNQSYTSKETLLNNIKDVLEANTTLILHLERQIEFDAYYAVPE